MIEVQLTLLEVAVLQRVLTLPDADEQCWGVDRSVLMNKLLGILLDNAAPGDPLHLLMKVADAIVETERKRDSGAPPENGPPRVTHEPETDA